jgi:uncharacterized Zn finger protein (UPF0148 family)
MGDRLCDECGRPHALLVGDGRVLCSYCHHGGPKRTTTAVTHAPAAGRGDHERLSAYEPAGSRAPY